MRLTAADKKAINGAARRYADGPLHHVEASYRYCWDGSLHGKEKDAARYAEHAAHEAQHMNLVYFEERGCTHDLADMVWLRDLKEVEDHPTRAAKVDLYIYHRTYTGRGFGSQDTSLSGNLTAEWVNGRLARVYDPLGFHQKEPYYDRERDQPR